MNLVDSLTKEHLALKSLLNEVKVLGITNPEGQQKLMKSKDMLLNHLRKEDELLYPELKKLEATKDISNSFQDEMRNISTFVLAFFNKYEKGVDEKMEFAKDFGRLMGELDVRIHKEEMTLYTAYQKYYEK